MKFETDPLGKFANVTDGRILNAIGILPFWALSAVVAGRDFKDYICEQYQYPVHEITGGETDEDGVFKYPEDPDMYPLAKLTHGDEYVYFYQRTIIDINGFRTRMD